MRPSRGMGAIKKTKLPSAVENKMPKGVVKKRRDNTDFIQYKEGGPVGLYENIHAKQKRILAGSGEKMRKPGTKGAPTAKAFKLAAKTKRK